ncbi:MAG: hypothetical protein Q9180_001302 [Flavoplaca navasiana]
MEDPNIILTLKACSQRAIASFKLPSNKARILPSSSLHNTDVSDDSSRGTTPSDEGENETQPYGSRIQLTFDNAPKYIERGFTFGADQKNCDVRLLPGSGRIHFSITFDSQGRLVLRDSSTHGTWVSFNDQGTRHPRHRFSWILFPQFGPIRIEIGKHGRYEFTAELEFPTHITCEADYLANLKSYMQKMKNADPSVDLLNFSTETAARTGALSPRQQPQYYIHYQEGLLGKGEFGAVYKATDVSSGNVYAAKQFFRAGWAKEVEIMRTVSHKHIVQFVNLSEEDEPRLIMDYLSLGNLEDQHRIHPIAVEETVAVLCQGLLALQYLHSEGIGYAHRDIKPTNILVESRVPFIIKLGDFGLAKTIKDLATCCGTYQYTAPEVWKKGGYTSAVDIWSLGVVIFEYAYGLPVGQGSFHPERWYRKLIRTVKDWDSEQLIDLLSTQMLTMSPLDRGSADDCCKEASELHLKINTYMSRKQRATPAATISTSQLMRTIQNLDSPKDVSPNNGELKAQILKATSARRPSLSTGPQAPLEIQSPQDDGLLPPDSNKRRRVTMYHRHSFDPNVSPFQSTTRVDVNTNFTEGRETSSLVRSERDQRTLAEIPFALTSIRTDRLSAAASVEVPGSGRSNVREEHPEQGLSVYLSHHRDEARLQEFAYRVQIRVDGKVVTIRKSDCWLSAIDILAVADKTNHEVVVNGKGKRLWPLQGPCDGWVSYEYGRSLCEALQLRHLPDLLLNKFHGYFSVTFLTNIIMIRERDFWVNGTHIVKAAGKTRREIEKLKKDLHIDRVQGGLARYQGSYVDFKDAIRISDRYGLEGVAKLLRQTVLDHVVRPGVHARENLALDCPKETAGPGAGSQAINSLHQSHNSIESVSNVSLGQQEEHIREVWPLNSDTQDGLPSYIQLNVRGKPVTMRKSDSWLNATEILELAGKDKRQRKMIFRLMKEHTKVEIVRASVLGSGSSAWVCYDQGRLLCDTFGLSNTLRSLLKFGQGGENDAITYFRRNNYLIPSRFIPIIFESRTIMMRESDCWINAGHVLQAAWQRRLEIEEIKKDVGAFEIVHGEMAYRGLYVSIEDGIQICLKYHLDQLARHLQQIVPEHQGSPENLIREDLAASASSKKPGSYRTVSSQSDHCSSRVRSDLEQPRRNPTRESESLNVDSSTSGTDSDISRLVQPKRDQTASESEVCRDPSLNGACSKASARKEEPRTEYREPSFSMGSFLPPVGSSFLAQVHPDINHQLPSFEASDISS